MFLPLFLTTLINMASPQTGVAPELPGLRVLAVPPSPEGETVVLRLALPEYGQVLNALPIWLQFRVEGYPLGSDSQFDRRDEVAGTDLGQTLHIVIDDNPYFAYSGPAFAAFDEVSLYYDSSYKIEIPYRLTEGMHTIRAFPARSFGESLKGENTYIASVFYVGKEKDNPGLSLDGPYITYNEPSNQIYLTSSKPILLDFYVTNCALTADGYKVRLSIDGHGVRTLTSWQPYYIYGLPKGNHTVLLELIDRDNKVVPGEFNRVQRSITVH